VGICAHGAVEGRRSRPTRHHSACGGRERSGSGHERRLDSPPDRQIQAVAGLQPALWARPRLTGDAVAVVIVLRIVARLAPPGGGQADRSRGRAVRRCRGMPEGHRQGPAGKVLDDRVEETGKGKGGERRHADPMPMPAQPGHGRALPPAERGHPSKPRHAVRIAALA
jgi:hypothetical protein